MHLTATALAAIGRPNAQRCLRSAEVSSPISPGSTAARSLSRTGFATSLPSAARRAVISIRSANMPAGRPMRAVASISAIAWRAMRPLSGRRADRRHRPRQLSRLHSVDPGDHPRRARFRGDAGADAELPVALYSAIESLPPRSKAQFEENGPHGELGPGPRFAGVHIASVNHRPSIGTTMRIASRHHDRMRVSCDYLRVSCRGGLHAHIGECIRYRSSYAVNRPDRRRLSQ